MQQNYYSPAQQKAVEITALTLANAVSVIIGVGRGIASRDVSSSIGGKQLMSDNLAQMACAHIFKNLNDRRRLAQSAGLLKNK